jgi:hypothetical protein
MTADYADDDPEIIDPAEYAAGQARAEDPPDSYLAEEAERHARAHRDADHGGGECSCPPAQAEISETAPF